MVQRLLARLWTRFIAYDIAYRLEAVDDRILADMGINRDDIPAFARRAAVPPPFTARPVAGAFANQPRCDTCGLAA